VTDNTVPGTPYSATYSYLANSLLVSNIVFKQSTTTRVSRTNQWDYLNRLLGVSSVPSAASALSFAYSYNNANQRTRTTLVNVSVNDNVIIVSEIVIPWVFASECRHAGSPNRLVQSN
jgi:hypothetical protein